MTFSEYLQKILEQPERVAVIAETMLDDIMDQLSIVDPQDDGEEMLETIRSLLETKEGRRFVCFLVGMPLAEYVESLAELDEESEDEDDS